MRMPLLTQSSGVYSFTCIINGKTYIGSTKRLKGRLYMHISELRKGTHHSHSLQKAWNDFGEDGFHIDVLEYCDASCLLETEQKYMDDFKSYNPEKGFNINEKAATAGCSFDRAARAYNRMSSNPDIPVYQFLDPRGNLVTVPKGALLAFCKEHGLGYKSMFQLSNGIYPNHKGWSRSDRKDLYTELISPEGKTITICKRYSQDFARDNGLNRNTFLQLINGKIYRYKGWVNKRHANEVLNVYRVISPFGETLSLNKGEAASFCQKNNIPDYTQFRLVLNAEKPEYMGYKRFYQSREEYRASRKAV